MVRGDCKEGGTACRVGRCSWPTNSRASSETLFIAGSVCDSTLPPGEDHDLTVVPYAPSFEILARAMNVGNPACGALLALVACTGVDALPAQF